ncbi:MAG TPA: hypothetical protein PLY95_03410 [Candidatus Paceibacterota bacterium]|nr:hypothetical protein [Smithellaceae bacterium]HQI26264.1 hypothetical protein [Candidatus Paceibacterota bacterium]
MAKKKNKIKLKPASLTHNYLDYLVLDYLNIPFLHLPTTLYDPDKIYLQAALPKATPISFLKKLTAAARRFITRHTLNIAIAFTAAACARWLACYCYLRFAP